MSLVEQELLILPEHLSSPLVFSGVRVTRSFVLYVSFVCRCLSFCTFSFSHCVVCPSSIYWFWLSLWYLQTLRKSVNGGGQQFNDINKTQNQLSPLLIKHKKTTTRKCSGLGKAQKCGGMKRVKGIPTSLLIIGSSKCQFII